jgi:hypothetical protein
LAHRQETSLSNLDRATLRHEHEIDVKGSLLLLGVVLAPLLAAAPNRSVAEPTPIGRPDLQGIWDFSTVTPLERPPEVADQAYLTVQEAREYERGTRDRVLGRMSSTEAKMNADAGDGWADWDNHVQPTRRTSLIVDPPNGRLPLLTSEGQRRRAVAADEAGLLPSDPETLPLATRCLHHGEGPPILPIGGPNNYLQIVQTDRFAMIMTEMIHHARIIAVDGRPHLLPAIRQWSGDSRGHWEGDTLIIETTNFTAKTPSEGDSDSRHRVEASPGAESVRRVVERLRRVGASALLYQFTVDDPSVFTRPFSGELTMRKTQARIYEYACHEGNYAIGGVLRGARSTQKEP